MSTKTIVMETVMTTVIERLIEYLPLWYIVLLCLVVFGMRFYYKRFKPLEKRTCNADCEKNKSNIEALSSDIKIVKQDLQDIKLDLVAIKSVLVQKYPKSADIFSMKKSPRRLNPLGEKIYQDIDGEKFLNDNLDFFFDKMDKASPRTALDVEKSAMLVLSSSTGFDFFNRLKDFVYNSPSIMLDGKNGEQYSYDITMNDICFVLSLPLRDKYLSVHSDLLPE